MQRIFLSLILSGFTVLSVMADERSEALRQIELAKKEVIELEKVLGKLKIQQSQEIKQLRQTELEIATLQTKITEIKKEQRRLEQELVQLHQDKEDTQLKLKEQEKAIALQAKATYENGQQEYVKLLLNQQEPEQISRTLTYYDYMSQAHLEQLALFKEALAQLKKIENNIQTSQTELDEQDKKLRSQYKELHALRTKRQQILAGLNKQIKDKNSRIAAREQDTKELNELLVTIDNTRTKQAKQREALAANSTKKTPVFVTTTGQPVAGSFAASRGKLPWPVNGRVIAQYGSTRGTDSRAKWDGVLISAARGTMVKAIFPGRVVFADWLRGVGQLIIVDHGDGYYSLYGHNQTLLRKVGDAIKAGDSLATVGNSGGIDSPALYFSIRQKGQTVNPSLWCLTL